MDLVIVRLGQTYNKAAFNIDKFIVEVLSILL